MHPECNCACHRAIGAKIRLGNAHGTHTRQTLAAVQDVRTTILLSTVAPCSSSILMPRGVPCQQFQRASMYARPCSTPTCGIINVYPSSAKTAKRTKTKKKINRKIGWTSSSWPDKWKSLGYKRPAAIIARGFGLTPAPNTRTLSPTQVKLPPIGSPSASLCYSQSNIRLQSCDDMDLSYAVSIENADTPANTASYS